MTDSHTEHETDADIDSNRTRDTEMREVIVIPENDRAEALGDLSDDELETVFLKTAEEVARRKSGRW